MTALSVPEIDRALASARTHFAAGRTTVAFVGPPTAGKSAALRHLASAMCGGTQVGRVVVVEFPRLGEDDAALVALANAAAQLDPSGSGLAREIRDPSVAFRTKLDSVIHELEAASNLLVTIDAPQLNRNPSPTMGMFQAATWTTFHRLAALRRPYVAVALERGSAIPSAEAIKLRAFSDPGALLAPDQWNGLGASAARTSEVFGARLKSFSPQMVRLAVVALALGAPEAEVSEMFLFRDLLDAVRNELSGEARTVLGRLGQVRAAFDEGLLADLGWSLMAASERDALRAAVLLEDEGQLYLHEDIARAVRASRGDPAFDEGHRAIATWHQARFESATTSGNVARAIRHELELVHHLTQTGEAEALEHSYFAEQYDAFGKSLSLARRYDEAVQAYERALEHQPHDAYAHHYLAYNLDIQGREAPRVDEHYRRALEEQDDHLWYHGRRLCFLVIRGHDKEALDAWREAIGVFMPDVTRPDDEFYKELHGHFARVLLHRGKLELAHEVLRSVPAEVRGRSSWWGALAELERGLTDAHAHKLVFPPSLPEEDRWLGPHLGPGRAAARIVHWMPGCVETIDDEGVAFRIAEQHEGTTRYGYRCMTWDELRKANGWGRDGFPTGTFGEIYQLQDGSVRVERWPAAKRPDGLLSLWPRPDRYIRRALAEQAD